MRDRAISISGLNELRLWIDTNPEVPGDELYNDFGSSKICGRGTLTKTFLLPGQVEGIKWVQNSVFVNSVEVLRFQARRPEALGMPKQMCGVNRDRPLRG